jgi:hypothetical protein
MSTKNPPHRDFIRAGIAAHPPLPFFGRARRCGHYCGRHWYRLTSETAVISPAVTHFARLA